MTLDSDGVCCTFHNFYRCAHQGRLAQDQPPSKWDNEWSCACNDKCPVCYAEIEPYKSEDLMKYKVRFNGSRKTYQAYTATVEVYAASELEAKQNAIDKMDELLADGDDFWEEDTDHENNFSTEIERESIEVGSTTEDHPHCEICGEEQSDYESLGKHYDWHNEETS